MVTKPPAMRPLSRPLVDLQTEAGVRPPSPLFASRMSTISTASEMSLPGEKKDVRIAPDSPLGLLVNRPVLCFTFEVDDSAQDFAAIVVFTVFDSQGHPLGMIRERPVRIPEGLWRRRVHAFDLTDVHNRVLLTIKLDVGMEECSCRVLLPGGKTFGKCVKEWHIWKRLYILMMRDSGARHYVGFGRSMSGPTKKYFPIENGNKETTAEISWEKQDFLKHLKKKEEVHVLKMDPSLLKNKSSRYKAVAKMGPTLEQRSVLLGAVVNFCYQYRVPG